MIYLSSFFGPGAGPRYSIARWAPKNFAGNTMALSWLGARDKHGRPLRHLEPGEFAERYFEYLFSPDRWRFLDQTIASFDPEQDITLCCWCTPERQRSFLKLYCHRILIGFVLEYLRPELPIAYVGGAENSVWPREEGLPQFYRNLASELTGRPE